MICFLTMITERFSPKDSLTSRISSSIVYTLSRVACIRRKFTLTFEIEIHFVVGFLLKNFRRYRFTDLFMKTVINIFVKFYDQRCVYKNYYIAVQCLNGEKEKRDG